jgi:formimidoylglutamate deiminase
VSDQEQPAAARRYFADQALLPDGWARDVLMTVDAGGDIVAIERGAPAWPASSRPPDLVRLPGPVIPGMPALHSHAFQRAMAGLAEHRAADGDDFWHWRELMYRFAGRMGPDEAEAIARWLYIELLEQGYTAVAEFHYVHRQPNGQSYAEPAEMMLAHLRAARAVGLPFTALPVLYQWAGFDRRELSERQARFRSTPDEVLSIAAAVRREAPGDPDVRAGLAPHSLRAADPEAIREAVAGLWGDDPSAPVHMHLAEQTAEVDACLAYWRCRPGQLMMDRIGLDPRWCLVHATHIDPSEQAGLARSGAVVGLCPTTEANLGDGVFPLKHFRELGGRWGIGGDSHVCRNPAEELRLLEYGQRLIERRRHRVTGPQTGAVGTTLWLEACAGGAQALGRPMGAIAPGRRADWVVLDDRDADLCDAAGDALSNAQIFAAAGPTIREVWVAGRAVVSEGRHPGRAAAHSAWRAARARLLADD